jgi:TrmH family RNA methyltransferase
LIGRKTNESFSQLDTASGIAAIYKMPSNNFGPGTAVYLESISDPGNLGTILRSALAFGFKNIVINDNCVDLYNAKTISAARDAIFKLNILEDKNYNWIKKNTLPIYATSSHDGQALSQFKPAQTYVLAFGNESRGLSQGVIDMSAKKIKIEISPEIESLNVASAAAILFYALRQNS